MKTAARKLLVVLWLLMLPPAVGRGADAAPPAAPAPSPQRDLLAHGTDELFWSADVVPTSERRGSTVVNGVKTIVRMRSAGQPQWREITPIAAQARDLANRGSELLVALDDGTWMIVTDDGPRSGVPLPGGARIVALCGDEDDIWAIGQAPRGQQLISIPPLKSPATTTSGPSTASTAAATTAPATAPSFGPHEVGLFLLRRGQWIERDVLPGNVHAGDILAGSLAIVDRQLLLAVATRDLAVRVWTRDESGSWSDGADVAVLGEKGRIKLLNMDGRPTLWVADGNANAAIPGALLTRNGQRWSEPLKLTPQPKLASFDRRTLAGALGRIRLLASDGRGQLKEQLYNADGSLSGDPVTAVTVSRTGEDWLAQLLQLLIVLVLIVWMVGSMRQRPAVREAVARADELRLAPLGRRFLGGLIDLVPLVVGSVLGQQALTQNMPPGSTTPPTLTIDSPAFAYFAAGMGLYLLMTTALELITRGRSLGKLITGTRVAALDGSRASAGALLTRNLLRIIDIILFFPLSFVFFSPLRQRVGDMAGGTIVISNDAPEVEPRVVERDDSEDD